MAVEHSITTGAKSSRTCPGRIRNNLPIPPPLATAPRSKPAVSNPLRLFATTARSAGWYCCSDCGRHLPTLHFARLRTRACAVLHRATSVPPLDRVRQRAGAECRFAVFIYFLFISCTGDQRSAAGPRPATCRCGMPLRGFYFSFFFIFISSASRKISSSGNSVNVKNC